MTSGADGHLLLFNRPAYLESVVTAPATIWRYDHTPNGRLIGSWVGVRTGRVLELGYHAPFGGPDLAGDPSPAAVLELIEAGMARVCADGIEEVLIRARPRSYGPAEEVVQYGLLQHGFSIDCCDLSFAVPLTGLTDIETYLGALPAGDRNRTKLRRALETDWSYRLAAHDDDKEWRVAFEVMAENRRSRGRRMSITLDYLLALRDRMPGDLHSAVLRVHGAPCAAALLYRVSPEVMLMVNWGDAGHDLARSPMPLLAAQVTVWASQQGARLLDLGRATEDGPPNLGLMQFKRSVMGRPEMRPNYRWTR